MDATALAARWSGSIWLFILAGMLVTGEAIAGNRTVTVDKVVIDSSSTGRVLNGPMKTHLELDREGDEFQRHCDFSDFIHRHVAKSEPGSTHETIDDTVPGSKVERLVEALLAPAREHPDLDSMGMDQARIQREVDTSWYGYGVTDLPDVIREEALEFRQTLFQPESLLKLVESSWKIWHTDDYPEINVEVQFSDGRVVKAHGTSQHFLLLPWKVGSVKQTWDVELPHAVADLMPDEATNATRLSAKEMSDHALEEIVSVGLYFHWTDFSSADKAGAALTALKTRFFVSNPVVRDFDRNKWLDVRLRLPDSPPNLALVARLRLHDGALVDSAKTLDKIARDLAVAASNRALNAHMESQPTAEFRIDYQGLGIVFNDMLREQYVSQMHSMGKLSDIDVRSSMVRHAVLVVESGKPTYWVVHPDGEAVRWKAHAREGVSPGEKPCEAIPIEGYQLPMDISVDACDGTVYAPRGKPLN
ncbi:MAG: hypothetical protein WBW92_07285 [Rhodanobacteraceae bacterium]